MRNRRPLGPYSRPMTRVQGGVLGVRAFFYGRGSPVTPLPRDKTPCCGTTIEAPPLLWDYERGTPVTPSLRDHSGFRVRPSTRTSPMR